MNKKSIFWSIVSIAVAMAFVMPVAAFGNFEKTAKKNVSNSGIVDNTIHIDFNNRYLHTLDDATADDNIEEISNRDVVDWWPMFQHDLAHTGCSSGKAPTTNTLLWNFTTGGDIMSSATVVDGKVYIGSFDNNMYCLDALTGDKIWNYTTGDYIFCSSAAVVNGKVYFGSSDYNIYCLNATYGSLLWNYTTDYWVDSSPTVVDGKVYIGSSDYNVYCLDADTGTKIWNYTTGDEVYSSPAVVNGKVYFGSYDCNVYCLDADTGTKIWNYTTGDFVDASPTVVDGKVYIGSDDCDFYCLDADTGTKIWNYTTGDWIYFSTAAVVNGKVYFGSDDYNIYCLNATYGSLLWNYTTGYWVDSSIAYANGRVYAGSCDSDVYCLDADTGAKIWNYTTGNDIYSSPAIANGILYIGSDDGNLYAFKDKDSTNLPPNVPSDPDPANHTIDVSAAADLSWTGGDPNGDPVTYDVYFGPVSPPPKVVSNQSKTTYDHGTMEYRTKYYWQIVAWDNHDVSTEGPIWHFTTGVTVGNTLYVDDDADPSWYDATHVKTIQEGINNATAGDTVYVYNGTYSENVIVNKQVDLIGESKNVIVDGLGNDAIKVTVNGISIDTFTITNGFYGIYVYYSSDNVIMNCDVCDNAQDGIYLSHSTNNDIINCNAYDNTRGNFPCGIIVKYPSDNNIINCSAYNNMWGIYVMYSANSTITNCNSYNNSDVGIRIFQTLNYTIANCNIYNNDVDGISIQYISTNSTITDCNIYNNKRDGMYIYGGSIDTDVTNCNVYNNGNHGIYLVTAPNNITNCNIYNNTFGLFLRMDFPTYTNNKLRDNTIYDNDYNFAIEGDRVSNFYHDIDVTNTINGKRILYLVEQSDLTFDGTYNFGYLGFISCTNITVENADVNGVLMVDTTDSTIDNVDSHDSGRGVHLWMASYINIINCTAYDNAIGINLVNSLSNNIENCNLYNNAEDGIKFSQSSDNNITNCNAYNQVYGIEGTGIKILYASNDNDITGCNIYNNMYGVHFYGESMRNSVINCSIYQHSIGGFLFRALSNNNLIHHNNFVDNNYYNAFEEICSNTWDNGTEGNYWDDYDGVDLDDNGIGDTPYNIPGNPSSNSQDLYPLMEPYGPSMFKITTLSSKWNIIASPFSYSINKADITVEYDGTDYTWADAVSGGIIANALFGWDRINQIYLQSDVLEPGCGYWLWSYNDCILKVLEPESDEENMEPYVPTMFIEITTLSYKWNIIAAPFSYSVNKADIIVEYDGMDYTWADAVSGGIIANALFGWDRINQIYLQSDVLEPGCGYWLWSYNDCILKYMME